MTEDINADEIERVELLTSSRTNRGKEYDWTPNTSRWTKGDEDRLYFNDSKFVDYVDLTSGFGHREGSAVTISTELNGDELHVEVEVYEKTYSATFKLHGLETDEGDEDGEPEIACDGGEDVTRHVDDSTIEDAIESNDDPDHPDAWTVEEVRDALAQIQHSFEGFWSEHMDGVEDGYLEVVADDGGIVVFADHAGHGWGEEMDALELDREADRTLGRILQQIHHELARDRTDYSWSTADPFVVRKPEGARDGQRYVESVVNSLMREGLSPGQAWAYYGVQIRGNSRNSWAKRCGYSDHSAVSEAVRKADDKLPR